MDGERSATVASLEAAGVLLVQDGNHGAYRPRPDEIVESGIPHIRAADLQPDGSIDFAGAQQLAQSAWDRIRKGRAQGGDTLLTHKGTVGRVANAPTHAGQFLCSPQTTFWRTLDPNQLDQGYLAAFLRSGPFQKQLHRIMHESDMAPYVSLTSQRALIVSLPPLSEQQAISSVIGTFDDKIRSNSKMIALQRQARVARWRHVIQEAREREPLANIASVIKRAISSLSSPDETFEHFSIPAFDNDERPDLCVGSSMASQKTVLPNGRVLLMSKLNPGTPRVWSAIASGFGTPVCSPEFLVLQPKPGIPFGWLESCVRSDIEFYNDIMSAVTGTTGSRQRIKPADAMTASVPILDGDSVASWGAFADPMIEREAACRAENVTLSEIRDLLLPMLISGRVRVPLSNDSAESFGAAVEALGQEPRRP